MATALLHTKARQLEYQGGVKRLPVPEALVLWDADWPDYKPVDYTAPRVLERPVWADPDFRKEKGAPLYNCLDGNIDRRSYTGEYKVVDGVPRNPLGRTGLVGRGLLGRWGPNHAADPIVSRWKQDGSRGKVLCSGKPVLEFVVIKRRDTGNWAIPGGMVDPGDTVSATLKKEFGEEAMNSLEATPEEKADIEKQIGELFKQGTQLYAGYCDDPRNTDNAWMETVAMNFHDESGSAFSKLQLEAGDDAGAVTWVSASRQLELYASHKHFIKKVVEMHNAAW